MRPRENIEQIIKKFDIDTNPEKDQQIFDELKEVYAKSQKSRYGISKVDIRRIIAKSTMVKIAAAVVIFISVSLFFIQQEQSQEIQTQQITQTAKSPAKLTTFASLTFTYHQGGMEMVKDICDKALNMAGQRPANISMKEFSEGINNEKSERTEL